MHNAKLVWATLHGEELLVRMARVSNPSNEDNTATGPKLIRYLIKHKHWSPFEMINVCVEIVTTRAISRQLLRHKSIPQLSDDDVMEFTFQEFSTRYATPPMLHFNDLSAPRLQDAKNRQASVEVVDPALYSYWTNAQNTTIVDAMAAYQGAINKGIAKELARDLLPEGLTQTRLYMNGTLRSWVHFYQARNYEGAQFEIRKVANECWDVIKGLYPSVHDALEMDSTT